MSAAAAVASAEMRALYRIVMADGTVVLARDLPRRSGSVTTFHANGSGALTGVPSENVVKIETSVTPARFPMMGPAAAEEAEAGIRPLEPGEAIDLGPMGDPGSATAAGRQAMAASAAGSGSVNGGGAYVNGGGYANGINTNGFGGNGTGNGNGPFDTRMFGGGAAPATGLLPNGQPANQALPGDILRAQSGNVPTMSLDTQTQTSTIGFPATVSSQTAIVNANGTPNVGPNGFPGTPQGVIGPNGFPGTTPQSAIGPNGFPGTPQTATGANGFPTAATPGTTGANGFPAVTASGAAQGNVGTNGFPASTATAIGSGQVIVLPNGTVTNVGPGVPRSGAGAAGKSQARAGAVQPKAGPAAGAPSSHR